MQITIQKENEETEEEVMAIAQEINRYLISLGIHTSAVKVKGEYRYSHDPAKGVILRQMARDDVPIHIVAKPYTKDEAATFAHSLGKKDS